MRSNDVRKRYADRGKTEVFEALKEYLGYDPGGVPYVRAVPAGSVKARPPCVQHFHGCQRGGAPGSASWSQRPSRKGTWSTTNSTV